MNKEGRKREQGFTLIEIIAVLVILGILAAVAVPKFMDMQEDSQEKAVQGALAALSSAVTMCQAQQLLNGTIITPGAAQIDLTQCGQDLNVNYKTEGNIDAGDFTGHAADTTGTITITVDTGPSWFETSTAGKTKSFDLY